MTPYLSLALFLCFSLTLANEAALREFTSGNNLFTSSAYKGISNKENGNFLFSPFSAETVLALTQLGAKDATAEQLRRGLYLPKSPESIKAAFETLSPDLKTSDLYTLQSANKVYVKDNFKINEGFKKTAVDVFDSDLEKIDFNQGQLAAKTINGWVEGRTAHKIKNLISPDVITTRTRAILVNALYLRGNWSIPFERYQTIKENFYKNGNEAVQVDTMHDTNTRKYFESKELNARFLELPFEGGALTFTIVLPDDKNGLPELENQLEKVFAAPRYTQEYVRISLPKFRVESQIDFKELLQQLGVTKMFRDDEADLSGIAGEKGDLVVDKVLQKAFVDVAENGVEAAAATYVAVGIPLSGVFSVTPPKEVKVDRPFIFYIKLKDLVVFAGRVVDPSH